MSSAHVWVMRGDGGEKDRLTSGSVDDVSPTLAPGGSRVVFVRRRADRRDELYRIQANGTGLTRLTRTGVAESNPVWSPTAPCSHSRRGERSGASRSPCSGPTERPGAA